MNDKVEIMGGDENNIFRCLLNEFPDIIHSVDTDGFIISTNKKACQLLGYTKDELIGKHIKEIYAPEVLSDMSVGFTALKKQGEVTTFQSKLISKTEEIIDVEIRSFVIYDDDGNFLKTFSILRDIREKIELQSQLLHSSRLAAIGELSSCIAHDIANPLAVISLYGEMMQETIEGGVTSDNLEVIYDNLRSIQLSTKTIIKLVTGMRNFSRKSEMVMEPVDIGNIIDEAFFMVANKIGDVTVICNIKPKTLIMGMHNELEQVFMNLFSNACDAMSGLERENKFITIDIDVVDPEYYVVSVKDSGNGVPEPSIKHIFDSFYTTKGRDKGTGLGLSICKSIVENHKGTISLNSKALEGAEFLIKLPKLKIGVESYEL